MLGREDNIIEGKEATDSELSSSGSVTREDRRFDGKKAANLL